MQRFSSMQLSPFLNLQYPQLEEIANILAEITPSKVFLEALIKILQKWPSDFVVDLFKDYFRFLVLSEKEFRVHRSMKHQLRIICYHYLMRKILIHRQRVIPNELDLELRLLRTRLEFPFGQKSVLGIAIAIHFSNFYERLEDQHILLAVQKLLPSVSTVKESFLTFQKPHELFRLIYLEIAKPHNYAFSLSEIKLLKNYLGEKLKKCVETLNPSVFGYCDTEESMRNIFFLSKELQVPSDLPQVMISFEEASSTLLIFKITVIRFLGNGSRNISECFQDLEESFEYIHERTSIIGQVEQNAKEASIFLLKIPKKPFLIRLNSSFNLYRARQYVFSLLAQAIGNFRDYNGGIFSKQLETFVQFKEQFREFIEKDPELLEDFFYALKPEEMQALIPFSSLVIFFKLFLQAKEVILIRKESFTVKFQKEGGHFFVIVRFRNFAFQENIKELIDKHSLSKEMSTFLNFKDQEGIITLGYIFQTSSDRKKKEFCEILRKKLDTLADEMQNVQVLRFCQQHLAVSLDPRLGGDEISGVILKMLFEGLMRIGKDGKPHFAIAKSVVISDSGKQYIFSLRECLWSNGDRVTAQDFSYTWKKILSPNFSSAFAYLFYVIKNAKKAKEGLVSPDEIGIKSLDSSTLVINLEHPCSYFLELTSHPLYSPVNHQVDRIHPNWPLQAGHDYICNGPFQLEYSGHNEVYELKKNLLYWDEKEVNINRIQIYKANGRKALEMFMKEEIDWFGRPLTAWEPFFAQNTHVKPEQIPLSSTYWYVFNTKQFPFHSIKLRQAFAYAIDRQAIIKFLCNRAIPAFTPLPFAHAQFTKMVIERDVEFARRLFEEALHELSIDPKNFPTITLIHPNNELRKKIALTVTEQWKEVFGIEIYLESYNFKKLFIKMIKGDYQMGVMSWRPWINDPLYTLNAFTKLEGQINFSKWENHIYQDLLEQANEETDIQHKNFLFAKAEEILIREMPVIPIFHENELFARKNYIQGIFPSTIGNIDFKYAYINKDLKYAEHN